MPDIISDTAKIPALEDQLDAQAPIRCNIVLHYQQTPMFPGIPFVSSPLPAMEALGFNRTFPFIEG